MNCMTIKKLRNYFYIKFQVHSGTSHSHWHINLPMWLKEHLAAIVLCYLCYAVQNSCSAIVNPSSCATQLFGSWQCHTHAHQSSGADKIKCSGCRPCSETTSYLSNHPIHSGSVLGDTLLHRLNCRGWPIAADGECQIKQWAVERGTGSWDLSSAQEKNPKENNNSTEKVVIHLCLESHAVEFSIYGEKSCFATAIASSYINYCVSILTIILPNLAHIVCLIA